jgi:hypothetical protein
MVARVAVLLINWLIAAAAGAQSISSAAALVDSRDECAALQGTWKPTRDGWRAACEVPWTREDCLRLGGSWTQVTKVAGGGRCLAGVSEWAIAQQCLDHGGTWGPPGSPTRSCTFESPTPVRVAKAADSGKLCDSQKDCTHGCVYRGPPVAQGADVLGRCRATNQESGCFFMVESGRLAGSICVK